MTDCPPAMTTTDWTILTLKELLESRIKALEVLREQDKEAIRVYIASARTALEIQAKEYERRLDGLNGEQSRIAASQATYVSREIWDRIQDDDAKWKRNEEVQRSNFVTQAEFRTYKETTDRALTLRAGQTQGFGMIGNVITFIAGVLFSGISVWAALHH